MLEEYKLNGMEKQKNSSVQWKNKSISTKAATFEDNIVFTQEQLKRELGIFGKNVNEFLLQRLLNIIRKNNNINKEVTTYADYINFIQCLNSGDKKQNNEYIYKFFDIEQKGYVTKSDFVITIQNVIDFISFSLKAEIHRTTEEIENIYEHLKFLNINSLDTSSIYATENKHKTDQILWISKSKFILLIESNYININDIINNRKTNKYANNYQISFSIYEDINSLISSFSKLKKMIQQKINIESSYTICTDEYIENHLLHKSCDCITTCQHTSEYVNNNSVINTNHISMIKKKISDFDSLSESSFENELDESLNNNELYKINEDASETEDQVYEMNNQTIKTVRTIKENQNKIKSVNDQSENINIKNKNKKFMFVKPFTNIKDSTLKQELTNKGIDLNDTAILINQNEFITYLDNIDNSFKKIREQIKKINPNLCYNFPIQRGNIYINNSLKSKNLIKHNLEESLIYFSNHNLEFYLKVLTSINKCISYIREEKYDIENSLFNEVNTFTHFSFDNEKYEFTEYYPKVFSNLRRNIYISNTEYSSCFNTNNFLFDLITGKQTNLTEIINENFIQNSTICPERFCFYSPNGKYLIKTLTEKEFEILQKILPSYYEYLITSKHSLLERILGIYKITYKSKEIYFYISKNIYATKDNVKISLSYDLKGSNYKRTSDIQPYKDLDFINKKEKIIIDKEEKFGIFSTLQSDTQFLQNNNITNYSFFIGIGNCIEEDENVSISQISTNNKKERNFYFNSTNKNIVYFFGIVDIFKEYDGKKKIENFFKSFTQGKGISCQPPKEYRERFNQFIRKCFD